VPPVDDISVQDLPHRHVLLLLYSPVLCCHSVFLSPLKDLMLWLCGLSVRLCAKP